MKTMAALLLLSCCALGADKKAVAAAESACGPRNVEFEVRADESQRPTPTPENGKALIYVVQEDSITSKFGIDGKWAGAVKGRTYFVIPIDPGEHHLCAVTRIGRSTEVSLHELKAEAGTAYYFLPHLVGQDVHLASHKFTLDHVDPDEGKDLVARAKYCNSHPK